MKLYPIHFAAALLCGSLFLFPATIRADEPVTITPVAPRQDTPAQTGALSADEAVEVALKDAGLSRENVKIWVSETYKYKQTVYEIDFLTKKYEEYEYRILSENGQIVRASYEGVFKDRDKNLTQIQAKAIALAHAGFSESEVRMKKEKMDRDHAVVIYVFNFTGPDSTDYEYVIAKESGQVLEWTYEADRYLFY